MIDGSLMECLIASVGRSSGAIETLNDTDRAPLHANVQAAFISDPKKVWWWQGLSGTPQVLEYGEDNGLAIIRNTLGNGEKIVYLFVTDDESGPWPVFRGKLGAILDLLSEQRFFEYFLVDANLKWILFDTHDNSLVYMGEGILKGSRCAVSRRDDPAGGSPASAGGAPVEGVHGG